MLFIRTVWSNQIGTVQKRTFFNLWTSYEPHKTFCMRQVRTSRSLQNLDVIISSKVIASRKASICQLFPSDCITLYWSNSTTATTPGSMTLVRPSPRWSTTRPRAWKPSRPKPKRPKRSRAWEPSCSKTLFNGSTIFFLVSLYASAPGQVKVMGKEFVINIPTILLFVLIVIL